MYLDYFDKFYNMKPYLEINEKEWEYIKETFDKKKPKILYGGSVNVDNIKYLKTIEDLDGFLIGGASQNSKKFIDIVKKTYK